MEIGQLYEIKKIYHSNEIGPCDESLSLWWKFIIGMNIFHCDENLSLRWRLITATKVYNCDENLSLS